ncbi:ATP synthase F1 subunit delta [Hugenholtzia roseola]|uniref:ATP synthase F1 subunit delta n=1 Tax=Hugenholtzia roseola TaxID=1002 RepID=UPI000413A93A|nr:ATP synthase F1 subunit delta [Hugenholtzia roseola]
MSDVRVASRYAKSIFDLALERGELEAVAESMAEIAATIKQNRDLDKMLKSPIINSGKKLNVLKAIFTQSSALLTTFFEILTRKGREGALGEVAQQFRNLYNQHKSISIAQVITAAPLDETLREAFKERVKQISGKAAVELHEKIDPTLIGGYVLSVAGKQVDDSIKTRLQELRKKLYTHN